MAPRTSVPLLVAVGLLQAAADIGLADSPTRKADQPFAKKMRILFIGNSFTYGNDLPGLLTAMMATRGIDLETKKITPGGCTLKKHWEDGKAVKAINEGGWDYVVIQEQSQMPLFHPPVTLKYAALLSSAAAEVGAEPVFFMTWAYKGKPEMQAGLARTYMKAGADANSLVAPVGLAWQRVLKDDPNAPLFAKDRKHPSPQGSYLTACVFYGTILRRDPAGLPGRLVIDKRVKADVIARRVLCQLKAFQVTPLQKAAWQVVAEHRSYKPVGETAASREKQEKGGSDKALSP